MTVSVAPHRNASLDGLRGLAVALVIAYHLNLVGVGWVGVQLFFVLSGFLITRQLLDLQARPSRTGTRLRVFYGRRALRIVPLAAVYLLLLWAARPWLAPTQAAAVTAQWPFAATYTSNWYAMGDWHAKTYFLDHFWSLAVEEQFYLLWPLLLFALPARWRLAALLALVLAGPLLRLAVWLWWPFAAPENRPHAVAVCTFSQLDAFAMGGLVALAGERLRRVPAPALWLVGALALAWLLGLMVPAAASTAPLTLGYPNTLPQAGQWLWGYTVVNALAALLLGLVVHRGFARGLFAQPALVRLGEVSYAAYLLHFPLAHLCRPAINQLHRLTGLDPVPTVLLFLPVYLSLLLGLCLLAREGIENPCLRLKQRWFPMPATP
ncbi:MAG: acyltransferase [Pseudomonadota bacterium]